MVCDKCEHQAKWYYTVILPHQAPGVSGKRYWCPSCVDGVPSMIRGPAPFVRRGVAPTLEEHLQDKLDEAWTKVSELEKRLKLSTEAQARQIQKLGRQAKEIREKTERLNEKTRAIRNHVDENKRLYDKVKHLEGKLYFGPPYHSMFAAQQQQYNEMMQAQIRHAQLNVKPSWIMPGGGFGCYAKGTKLMPEAKHEAIVDSLNTQLKAQQKDFEKREGKINQLRDALLETIACSKNQCTACRRVSDQA